MATLPSEETERYSRQILLDGIGVVGQQKLKNASVLVIGAGGLGVPALQYLVAAGIGKIGIVDGDVIELSNLQRQVLYSEAELGRSKAVVAKEKLELLNSSVEIISRNEFLSSENAREIFDGYEIIIDGSDNFPTRYLVNDVCVKLDKPFISGAVFKFSGQVGVFNLNGGGTYRCLFPQPPKPEDRPDCNEVGVMGVVPGMIGMLMANEVLKIICGAGEVLAGKMLNIDFLTMKFQSISFRRDVETVQQIKTSPLMNGADYENFCSGVIADEVKEISAVQLREMIEQGKEFQLIDVREPFEREAYNIGGDLIPFGEVMDNVKKISQDKPVVFYCKVGVRSRIIVQRLQQKSGMKNLFNLRGGILSFLPTAENPS